MSQDDLKVIFQLLSDANFLAEKHRWLPLRASLEESLAQLAKLFPEFAELEAA